MFVLLGFFENNSAHACVCKVCTVTLCTELCAQQSSLWPLTEEESESVLIEYEVDICQSTVLVLPDELGSCMYKIGQCGRFHCTDLANVPCVSSGPRD